MGLLPSELRHARPERATRTADALRHKPSRQARVAGDHRPLEARHRTGHLGFSAAPQRTRRVQVERRGAVQQLIIDNVHRKYAAAAIKVRAVARHQGIPCLLHYPALEDYIEQERPCRRQGDGSLVSRQAATREHSFSEREVASLMPEALLAEIVRHAMLEDSLEYSHDVGRGRYLAQCDPKVVGAMRAALEFASVASGLKNTDTFRPEAAPVRLLCAGTPNAEPLARHSVSILESGVAYIR